MKPAVRRGLSGDNPSGRGFVSAFSYQALEGISLNVVGGLLANGVPYPLTLRGVSSMNSLPMLCCEDRITVTRACTPFIRTPAEFARYPDARELGRRATSS